MLEGLLLRRQSKQRPDLIGKDAGHLDNCGYVRVAFRGKKYLRSHLMFALRHGRLPTSQLDHINRIRMDDRTENLREVSHSQNMCGIEHPKNDHSRWELPSAKDDLKQKLCASESFIVLGGLIPTLRAALAYQQKRKELYREFA